MTPSHAPGDGTPGRHRSQGHHGLARHPWTREEALGLLEAGDRRHSEDPEEIWIRVGLASGETVVDIGAGTGYFALPAARRVGRSGAVYAVDRSADLVEFVGERAARESLPQLTAVRSTVRSIPLPARIADVVLLANVLHDVPESTVAEAVRVLKSNGCLVNVDWKPGEGLHGGPPDDIRLSPEDAARRLTAHRLVLADRWEFGPWHYALVLRKAR